jgi:hypothetical protein
MDLGHRLNYRPVFTKAHMLKLAGIVTAVFFSCIFTKDCLAAPGLSFMQTAEQWEDIAKMRQQIARDHEIQSGNIVNGTASNGLEAGDLLDLAGDETFLAAQNYQLASQQWDKAATGYTSAGASVEAKKARENADRATAAAKRALSDGVYFHTKAKEQYKAINNLNKQIVASEKVARNLELLINEGLVLPWLGN